MVKFGYIVQCYNGSFMELFSKEGISQETLNLIQVGRYSTSYYTITEALQHHNKRGQQYRYDQEETERIGGSSLGVWAYKLYTPTIVVTRHLALVKYLIQKGIINEDTPVITHASEEDVKGNHVIGVLPLRLAAIAETVTEIPLEIPLSLRGKELTLSDIECLAGNPATYKVERREA